MFTTLTSSVGVIFQPGTKQFIDPAFSCLRWELIKITISFSKGKTKHRRSREIQLQNRLED